MSLDTVTEENNESPDEIVTKEVKIENLLILNTIGTGAGNFVHHLLSL